MDPWAIALYVLRTVVWSLLVIHAVPSYAMLYSTLHATGDYMLHGDDATDACLRLCVY